MISQTRLLYSAQKAFRDQYTVLMQQVIGQILAIINRNTDSSGVIPIRNARRVVSEVQAVTDTLFTVQDRPLDAPYALMLYGYLESVSRDVVEAHGAYMRGVLSPGAVEWLRHSPVVPTYDPFHRWVDPRGHMLSDRIWSSALVARQKLGKYLTQNISLGTSSLTMARDLENMLLPARVPLRTTRPYGVDVSFDSMRLARTEIARAHTETTFLAAEANPFVVGMDWALSASHPRIDICDSLATIGMGGERIREPYPLDSAPHVVSDSHPQCICNNRPAVANEAEVRDELEADYVAGNPAPLTPLALTFISAVAARMFRG